MLTPGRRIVTPTWSPLSAEKRSDRVRGEAIKWRLRNPDKDFGLELQGVPIGSLSCRRGPAPAKSPRMG